MLTYAGLTSAHYEIWMMFRHVGRSGGKVIVVCQQIVRIWARTSASDSIPTSALCSTKKLQCTQKFILFKGFQRIFGCYRPRSPS